MTFQTKLWDATGVDMRALRDSVASEIERLIALLDQLDGNPDLEPDADAEPWLGWHYTFGGNVVEANLDQLDDLEADDELDEDADPAEEDGSDEPSLGRLETISQERGSYGGDDPDVVAAVRGLCRVMP